MRNWADWQHLMWVCRCQYSGMCDRVVLSQEALAWSGWIDLTYLSKLENEVPLWHMGSARGRSEPLSVTPRVREWPLVAELLNASISLVSFQ